MVWLLPLKSPVIQSLGRSCSLSASQGMHHDLLLEAPNKSQVTAGAKGSCWCTTGEFVLLQRSGGVQGSPGMYWLKIQLLEKPSSLTTSFMPCFSFSFHRGVRTGSWVVGLFSELLDWILLAVLAFGVPVMILQLLTWKAWYKMVN